MWRKSLLSLLVVAVAAGIAMLMVARRPEVEVVDVVAQPPLVRTVTARVQALRLDVNSQGAVVPRTEAELVAEVSGRIRRVSPNFEAGGFFDEGEVLVWLDDRDYELARAASRAQLAQARVRVAREQAEAEVALEEWAELGEGQASPLVLREPQLQEARAALAAAEAQLARTELDLERTRVQAPFAGRVRSKEADVGEFVNRGNAIAEVYAVDWVEVRLPVPDDELRFLDLEISYADAGATALGPEVELAADFAGQHNEWRGRVVRTEGELDPQSRMVHLVARVEAPYARPKDREVARPPLAVGLFVVARIHGRTIEGLIELPRSALRGERQVLVVDREDRLHHREVEVLRRTPRSVVLSAGLEEGERVCVSPLDAVVEGMAVRVVEESAGGANAGIPSAGGSS
jgi:RND family efflux transporter MFP subunit